MSRLAGLDMLRQESPRKETRHPSAVAAIGGYPEGIKSWGSGLMRRRTFRAGCLGVVRSSVGGGGAPSRTCGPAICLQEQHCSISVFSARRTRSRPVRSCQS